MPPPLQALAIVAISLTIYFGIIALAGFARGWGRNPKRSPVDAVYEWAERLGERF